MTGYLPDTYGYVLLICVIIGFELLLIGFLIPGSARRKTFTESFMKDNFGQAHREAFC